MNDYKSLTPGRDSLPNGKTCDHRKLRGENTREKLIFEALGLFSRYGYTGTNTRAIASAAGCNLGLIAFHFGGKKGLYDAVIEKAESALAERIRPVEASLRDAVQRRLPSDEMLEFLINTLVSFLMELSGREELINHRLLLLRDMHEKENGTSKLLELLLPLINTAEEAITIISPDAGAKAHITAFLLVNAVIGFLRDYPAFFNGAECKGFETRMLSDILSSMIRSYYTDLKSGRSSEVLHV